MADNKDEKKNSNEEQMLSEHVEERDDETDTKIKRRDVSEGSKTAFNIRDLITADHMDPGKLAKIRVHSNRADVMNEEDEATFNKCMKEFSAIVFGKEPDENEFLAFYISLVQCWLNQSTSLKNARQKNLLNVIEVGDLKKTWRTSDFMNYVKGNLPHVPNPFRQYADRKSVV